MLSKSQIRYLRALANTCENKYQLGKYEISESLIDTLSKALDAHELIKVTLNKSVVAQKVEIGEELATKLYAELVQIIGGVIVLYRKNMKKPKIQLPQ